MKHPTDGKQSFNDLVLSHLTDSVQSQIDEIAQEEAEKAAASAERRVRLLIGPVLNEFAEYQSAAKVRIVFKPAADGGDHRSETKSFSKTAGRIPDTWRHESEPNIAGRGPGA